jgi:hypothetical protein
MDTDPAKDALLNDVLADAASPAFREDLLRLTLEQVQGRQRRQRRSRRLLAAAGALLVLAVAARFLPRHNALEPSSNDSLVVHSRPLRAGVVVTTQPGSAELVRSSAAAVAWVMTSPNVSTFDRISDEQLFALLGGRPAALVHQDPARAELVFLNPADERGFPVR